MAEYKTKYAIGDLVYVATSTDVDRLIVDAVKVTGTKEEVTYRFKGNIGSGAYGTIMFYTGDAHNWRKASELFDDKESAVAHHENLKAKYEAEELNKKKKRIKERKRQLEDELEALENGEDTYEY